MVGSLRLGEGAALLRVVVVRVARGDRAAVRFSVGGIIGITALAAAS